MRLKRQYQSVGRTFTAFGGVLLKGADKASKLNSQYNVIKNNLVTSGESVAEATRVISQMQADGEKYSLRYGKSQKKLLTPI